MIVRAGRGVVAAFLIAIPVFAPSWALAGDGSFGVPASGILLPPLPHAKTASLIPPERAAPEKLRPVQRVQQTYSPAPADGAGRSRVVPPSEAPIHSPIVVPPKKKQFKAPTATVDPSYVERLAAGSDRQEAAPVAAPAPVSRPVMAQGAAAEGKRGLFTSQTFRNRNAPVQTARVQTAPVQLTPVYTTSAASAAYNEHVAAARVQTASIPQPAAAQPRTASRFSFGGAKPSARANDGTPCGQLRGIFTSPAECR